MTKHIFVRTEAQVHNKSIAIMAVDVNTLTPVLWKNISDYPCYLEIEIATQAIAKPLSAIAPRLQITGARFHRGLVLTLRDST